MAGLIADLKRREEMLQQKMTDGSQIASIDEKAHFYAYEIMEDCASIRQICDRIEERVDDQLWPLPKYREMLFLS